jgi:hypothetical protein
MSATRERKAHDGRARSQLAAESIWPRSFYHGDCRPWTLLLLEPAGPSRTGVTVPQRLVRPGSPDQDAWKQSADHYGPRIYTWCLRWQTLPRRTVQTVQTGAGMTFPRRVALPSLETTLPLRPPSAPPNRWTGPPAAVSPDWPAGAWATSAARVSAGCGPALNRRGRTSRFIAAAYTHSRKEWAPKRWSLSGYLASSHGMVRGRAGCQISPGLAARRLVYSSVVSPVAEMTGRLTRPDVLGAARFYDPREGLGRFTTLPHRRQGPEPPPGPYGLLVRASAFSHSPLRRKGLPAGALIQALSPQGRLR